MVKILFFIKIQNKNISVTTTFLQKAVVTDVDYNLIIAAKTRTAATNIPPKRIVSL